MKKVALGVALAAPLVFAAAPGFAATALSSQDKSFVHDAAEGGLAEVEAGKLAEQKGTSADVKKFANTMVTDHTKANDELKRIAENKGETAPGRIGKMQEDAMQELRKASGADFDRQYAKTQVDDHQKTVALFEKEANGGTDPDLKAFAQKTLPTLRHHLEMAQALPSKG